MKTPANHVVFSVAAAVVMNSAAMDITTYEKQRNEPSSSQRRGLLTIYLVGVGEGFKWANAALAKQKQSLLFCASEKISLNADNYVQVIDEALASDRDAYLRMDFPVESILLHGLQKKLSCGAK